MGGTNINHHKSWHTGTNRNIERVFKAEEKRQEELRKTAEIKQRLAEERDRESMTELHNSAKGVGAPERLDWMYNQHQAVQSASSNPTIGKSEKGDFEALLGDTSQPGALFQDSVTAKKKLLDQQAKLRDDPLLAIKQAELEGVKSVFNNPIKMKMLQAAQLQVKQKMKEVDKKEKKSKKSKKEKKKEKKSKKEKKKEKKRKHSDSSDDSSSSDDEKPPAKQQRQHEEGRYDQRRDYQRPTHYGDRDRRDYGDDRGRQSYRRDYRDTPPYNDRNDYRSPTDKRDYHRDRRHDEGRYPEPRGRPNSSGSSYRRGGSSVTKSMDKAEIEKRLAAMRGNSAEITGKRRERLDEYERVAKEEEQKAKTMNYGYVRTAQRELHGGKSMADTVRSKKHYSTRESQSMADDP
eukprot:TRINITY_DN67927_c5_g9_i1.p1 TRINITY_DN67927_c5_g9~~TRINITY_DN67927_c5_g9_i1.p1  ORF type:complete len:405 (-),score=49.18 TRINITY_DN67927_c5_g9_i1:149-1363(-)